MTQINKDTARQTLLTLRSRLLSSHLPQGCWQGELASSALATATAVFALAAVDKEKHFSLIRQGLDWLRANSNVDGGWGDTIVSESNLPATLLGWTAFSVAENSEQYHTVVADAESWLTKKVGGLNPENLVNAINQQYGSDRTFSVPILTMCALAGRLGSSRQAWRFIKPLPFELAACPQQLLKYLPVSVVSYALPALIAMGQANYHHRTPANPLTSLLRFLTKRRTLAVLKTIQPTNGGFLEAIPLTSFVVMSLASVGQKDSTIVSKATDFLTASVRSDGSWPIDTNLATWLTTQSVNALAVSGGLSSILSVQQRRQIQNWLLAQQYHYRHPYTNAAPLLSCESKKGGGWAWTDLPGGVPDADDTASALIALRNLDLVDQDVIDAVAAGTKWLLSLQNRDGGFATFCRGWTALKFDQSAADLTAHAIYAMTTWRDVLPRRLSAKITAATRRALEYLNGVQKEDGSWIPLWFGNENAPQQQNPVYGTARVLTALQHLPHEFTGDFADMSQKAVKWLLSAQNNDGGWGGAKAVTASVEETAVAAEALTAFLNYSAGNAGPSKLAIPFEKLETAVVKGTSWLVDKTRRPEAIQPAPIGLYFAQLWYYERLYPLIFAVSALGRSVQD